MPEELFGPLSLAALDEGRYERDIEGYLPTASVAFLDEVFKANSAILNALLTLLNEREFDQGAVRIAVPLVCAVGASNEMPDDESLRAFHDRFLFRCPVAPVSDEAFDRLLLAGQHLAPPAGVEAGGPLLELDGLSAARGAAAGVLVPPGVPAALCALRSFLAERQVVVSDRRWVRILGVLRVAAVSNGRAEVDDSDLWLLQFLTGDHPEHVEQVAAWYAGWMGAAHRIEPERLARVVQAFDKQRELEYSATELAFDDSGKLSLMRTIGGAEGEAMSDAAPRTSAFSRRKRFSASHIAARIAQIDAVRGEIAAFEADFDAHERQVTGRLEANLWVAPVFVARVRGVFDTNRALVREQARALDAVRAAFAELPLADSDDGRVPLPVDLPA